MSQANEVLYSARIRAPQVFERARTQLTTLEVYRDGALAAPSSGTYTLVTDTGTAIVDAEAVTVTNSIATYTLTAVALPATLSMGEGYQERWALVMPDATTRTFTREASLAKFQLAPSITDADLLAEYPDLLDQIAGFGTDLQDWIDEAWAVFLGELYALGEWPDVIVSRAATREPLKQGALFLIYKFLFSRQANAERFEALMERHEAAYRAALGRMTYRVDRDQDGIADDANRHGSTTVVHRNAAPRRTRSRSNRW